MQARQGMPGGNSLPAPTIESSGSSYRRFLKQRHFGSLDGLRCISIVAVIWAHGPGEAAKSYLLRNGRLGVELFFAISGFLITTLLLRERRDTGRISLRRFYARRALRIFPLYYAILAVYVVLVIVSHRTPATSEFLYNLRFFLTYTANWFVGVAAVFSFAWSLSTEEQFYCAWPWVERYFGRASFLLMAVFVVLLTAFRIWIPLGGFAGEVAFSVSLTICLGVLLAHLLDHPRGYRIARRCLGFRLAPLIAVAASLALIATHPRKLVLATAFPLIVGTCVIREDHWLRPVLASRPFVEIGKVSYGMYLLHGLAYNVVEAVAARLGLPRHGMAVFLAALGVTFLAASISYRYYEAIFLRLKPPSGSAKSDVAVAQLASSGG